MNRILTFLSAVMVCSLLSAESAYLPFTQLSVDNGLPHTDVQALYQDRDGFMWIGTSSGVCRYDGVRIEIFNFSNTSLQSSRISCLAGDPKRDILYIGTETGGLSVFDLREKAVIENIPIPTNRVNHILPDGEGNVWVCGDGGLSHIIFNEEGKDIVFWAFPSPIRKAIPQDGDGNIWVVTGSDIVSFNRFSGTKPWISVSGINDLLELKSGLFVAATNLGTYFLDKKTGVPSLIDKSPSKSLLSAPDGTIYIGTFADGLIHLKADYSVEASYPFRSEITSLLLDRSGVLWLGLISDGCYKKNPNTDLFHFWSIGKSPLTMAADAKNRLWVSSRDGDLFVLDNGEIRQVGSATLAPFQGNPVSAIMAEENGDLLLGSWIRGFGRIRGENVDRMASGKAVPMEQILTRSSIYKFVRDAHGALWVSTNNGVWLFDGETSRHFTKDADCEFPVMDNFSTDILVDDKKDGREVWVGSSKGITVFTCSPRDSIIGVRHIGRALDGDGLCGEFVSFIHKDKRGDIWVATLGGGLNKLSPPGDHFELYNTASYPFPSNELESIVEDANGVFWIGGPGIIAFDPVSKQIRRFTKSDGLQSDVFKIWMSASIPDGSIAFGGLEGFNTFDPKAIVPNPVTPNVVITNLLVNGQAVSLREIGQSRLPHTQNNLSFDFAALDFAKPERNLYRYRLEGEESGWRDTDGMRPNASYLNLRPGKYKFVVTGSNGDGIWSSSPAEVSFSIAPPLWGTLFAKIFYVLVLLGTAVVFFLSWRRRNEHEHQIEVERTLRKEQQERNENEYNFHTDFLHEIKTPLTLIKAPAEELLQNKSLGKSTRSHLQLILQSSNIIQKHLDTITDLRKYDNGQIRLHVVEVDFCRFVEEIVLLFLPVFTSKSITFHSEIPKEPLKVFLDKDKIEKVILNLMSNAVKYSPQHGGDIRVCVWQDGDNALFSVSNIGIGIPPGEDKMIFERFRRGSNNHNQGGMGIGLAISKHAVESHGGHISVNSVVGGETVFTISLPMGEGHFNKEDIDRDYANSDDLSNYDKLADLRSIEHVSSYVPERTFTILVADDSPSLLEYFREMLSHSYNVLTVSDGQTCYERAIAEQPDLIITDVVMPRMNGLELCTRLKQNPDTSHIPVILLSARDLPVHKIEGYSTMADDYITKPFHYDVLLSRIANLISLRESMRNSFKTEVSMEPSAITSTPMDERFIRRCIEDIEEHISEPDYGVNQLCSNIGVSRPQLYRKVKSITGLSAIQFVRSVRIKRAAQLLASDSSLSVTDVMFAVGFNNLSYFSKVFATELGVLPKDYSPKSE